MAISDRLPILKTIPEKAQKLLGRRNLKELEPQDPEEGPPLPKKLGIKWPWKE